MLTFAFPTDGRAPSARDASSLAAGSCLEDQNHEDRYFFHRGRPSPRPRPASTGQHPASCLVARRGEFAQTLLPRWQLIDGDHSHITGQGYHHCRGDHTSRSPSRQAAHGRSSRQVPDHVLHLQLPRRCPLNHCTLTSAPRRDPAKLSPLQATLNSKSPWLTPFGRESEADAVKRGFKVENSDFLTTYNAYCSWREASGNGYEREFCRVSLLRRLSASLASSDPLALRKTSSVSRTCR